MSVIRGLLAMLAFPLPAHAWEASFDPPVCLLSEDLGNGSVVVSHDPRASQPYAISLTRDARWPDSPVFAIRFEGPNSFTISTNRHQLSDDGLTLTVTDTGFGNVLVGLEQNVTATAIAGSDTLVAPLEGAAPEVERFRACLAQPSV